MCINEWKLMRISMKGNIPDFMNSHQFYNLWAFRSLKCNIHIFSSLSAMNKLLIYNMFLLCIQWLDATLCLKFAFIFSLTSAVSLRLESPTRFLSMEAPKGVYIKAMAGNVDAESSLDVILHSTEGLVSAQPQHSCILNLSVNLTLNNSNNWLYHI